MIMLMKDLNLMWHLLKKESKHLGNYLK